MEDSSTCQLLVEREARGLEEGLRTAILIQGQRRFGPPDATSRAALEAIHESVVLEQIIARLDETASWADLLQPGK